MWEQAYDSLLHDFWPCRNFEWFEAIEGDVETLRGMM